MVLVLKKIKGLDLGFDKDGLGLEKLQGLGLAGDGLHYSDFVKAAFNIFIFKERRN